MATQADVRRIAMALPGTIESTTDFAFSVINKGKAKGFAWVWKERIDPRKARVPQPKVLAVMVTNLAEKDLIISSNPKKFFTEPHYNGFPAVLVRLAEATVSDLRMLLTEAWRRQSGATEAPPAKQSTAAPSAPATRRAKAATIEPTAARRRAGG